MRTQMIIEKRHVSCQLATWEDVIYTRCPLEHARNRRMEQPIGRFGSIFSWSTRNWIVTHVPSNQ